MYGCSSIEFYLPDIEYSFLSPERRVEKAPIDLIVA